MIAQWVHDIHVLAFVRAVIVVTVVVVVVVVDR